MRLDSNQDLSFDSLDQIAVPTARLRRATERVTGDLGWGWPLVGFAATAAMSLAGSALVTATDGPSSQWWYAFTIAPRGGQLGNFVVFYAGMIALSVAWLALGCRLSGGLGRGGLGSFLARPTVAGVKPRHICAVAVLWGLPLVVGPSLFSRDMYSYAGQGLLAHVGLNPYVYGPGVLGVWGHQSLVSTVAPVWRSTVAPYGPTFITLAGLVTGGAASLVATVIDLRLMELVGVGLIALFVPRLARAFGADPGRAAWLAVLSPVVLLSLVAAGHNDALMAGLLLAGVTLALERRPLLGIVLCAVAATIKVPAAAGVVFIAVAWARDQQPSSPRARVSSQVRVLATAGLATAAVFVGVSAASGLGWGWLSVGALSTPGQVVVLATPTTALGVTVAAALHALGLGPSTHSVLSAARVIGLAGAAFAGGWLLWRTRFENLVLCLGVTLLAVVVAGPVTWPWYLVWSIPLLACWPATQRSRALVLILAGFGFVVSPAGSSALSAAAATPAALTVVAASVLAWKYWRHSVGEQMLVSKLAEAPSDVGSWSASPVTPPSQRV